MMAFTAIAVHLCLNSKGGVLSPPPAARAFCLDLVDDIDGPVDNLRAVFAHQVAAAGSEYVGRDNLVHRHGPLLSFTVFVMPVYILLGAERPGPAGQ